MVDPGKWLRGLEKKVGDVRDWDWRCADCDAGLTSFGDGINVGDTRELDSVDQTINPWEHAR